MILERRECEAALVSQRAQQIVDGVIARHRRTRGSRYTVVAMRSPVPGSVLVMEHDRTSLKVWEVRSIADAYVRLIRDAGVVGTLVTRGKRT